MTEVQTIPEPAAAAAGPTPQQHHIMAAEQLAVASKHHHEAAMYLNFGEHNTAAQHARLASVHLERANLHAAEAGKKHAMAVVPKG